MRIALLAIASSFLIGGCAVRVNIPREARLDQPPTIHIYSVVLNTGFVSQDHVTNSTTVLAKPATSMQLFAHAENPGGVSSFVMTIQRAGVPPETIAVSQMPIADGTAWNRLDIVGGDGAGGPGNMPILLSMPPTPSLSDAAAVLATALNFHGQTASVTIKYVTDCGCPPGSDVDIDCSCRCPGVTFGGAGVCGTRCCAPGESCCGDKCILPGESCANCLPSWTPCNGGCCSPLAPVCRAGLCYPF